MAGMTFGLNMATDYSIPFTDPWAGSKILNEGRLKIALDERKRQQDLADAAALFDRQLSKQATFEQMRLNATSEQEMRRIDAQEAAAERRLAAEHNFRIDQREADRVAEREKLRESNKLDLEALKKKNEETFKTWERTHKILKADKAEGTDIATSNYLITKAELDDLDKQATALMEVPQSAKNRIVAEVVNSLSKDEKLKKSYFLANSDRDISQNLNKLPKGIRESAEEEIKARLDAFMAPRQRQANALIIQGGRRQQSLDKFIDDIDLAKAKGLSLGLVPPPNAGIESVPANPANQIQQFKAKRLAAAGQQMFGEPTPLPATTIYQPTQLQQSFEDVLASRAGVDRADLARNQYHEDIGLISGTPPYMMGDPVYGKSRGQVVNQMLARRDPGLLSQLQQVPQSVADSAYLRALQAGKRQTLSPLAIQSQAPRQAQPTGLKLDDVVRWLSTNEPTMRGMNPMVIKAILSNPVNQGRLTGWIEKYQQSQGVAQQGSQMFGQPTDTGIYQPGEAESAIYQTPY